MVNGRISGWVLTITLLALSPFAVFAEVNTWTKPSDGNWLETNSWSLGRLPNPSDDIEFAQSPVSITIDSSTAELAPSSFSIHKLTVGTANTLSLDNPGDAVFRVASTDIGEGNFFQNGGTSDFGRVLVHG